MVKFELKLRKRNISKDELIADLVRVAKDLGSSTLTSLQYSEKGSFGVTTYLRKFG